MAGFFNYFPSMLYANTAAVNLIAKIRFEESVSKNLAVFYPYTLEEGERADQVAENYYEDSNYDWVVYLSNGILDPYNEWPKPHRLFDDHMQQKFGSIANSQQQTAFYRVNYEFDDRVISTAAYAALSAGQKKYWAPTLNATDQVIGYIRKDVDLYVETNKTIGLSGTFGNFDVNTILTQTGDVQGTVSFSNSSYMVLKHITGTWSATTTRYISNNSVANVSISTITTLSESIPVDEVSYFNAVSYYEFESEYNESKKNIRLLSLNYLDVVERDMRDLLKT